MRTRSDLSQMQGRWRAIKNFPDYLVSDKGEVFSLKVMQVMKPYVNHKGYFKVGLFDENGKKYKKRVNRLVAETFIPNPLGLPEVNHKNLDKQDNRVANLEWVTGKQNREHYQRMKLQGVV